MSVSKIMELLNDQLWMLKELLKQTKSETKMGKMIRDFIWETRAEMELLQQQEQEQDGDPE